MIPCVPSQGLIRPRKLNDSRRLEFGNYQDPQMIPHIMVDAGEHLPGSVAVLVEIGRIDNLDRCDQSACLSMARLQLSFFSTSSRPLLSDAEISAQNFKYRCADIPQPLAGLSLMVFPDLKPLELLRRRFQPVVDDMQSNPQASTAGQVARPRLAAGFPRPAFHQCVDCFGKPIGIDDFGVEVVFNPIAEFGMVFVFGLVNCRTPSS